MSAELLLSHWTSILLLLHQFSARDTRNRLGGLEETLFECSLGVGKEERPPNVVVVQLNQVLQCFNFTVLNV